jgi:glutamate dehydrogenase/leucine dehydrogenase
MAAKLLKLDPAVHSLLREPKRILVVPCPVRMDGGQVKAFTGFRVQ